MSKSDPVTAPQLAMINRIAGQLGVEAVEVATRGEAQIEIDRLKGLRENHITPKQEEYLRRLCEDAGVEYVSPATRSELQERIDDLTKVTPEQEVLLARLQEQTGQKVEAPKNKFEASAAIDQLLPLADGAHRERMDIAEEAALTGGTAAAIRNEEFSQDSDYAIDAQAERFDAATPAQQEILRARAAERAGDRDEDFELRVQTWRTLDPNLRDVLYAAPDPLVHLQATMPATAAEIGPLIADWPEGELRRVHETVAHRDGTSWANSIHLSSTPGDPASAAQVGLLEQLCEENGVAFVPPLDKREANQMITQLKGPGEGPSPEQLQYMESLAEKVGKRVPDVSTKQEASEKIDEFSRIQYARDPNLRATDRHLSYLEELCKEQGIPYSPPTSAIQAVRMIDAMKEFRTQDPAQQGITRDLLTLPQAEFDAALNGLKPVQQQVLVARYRSNLSVEEAAAQLAISHRDVDLHETIARDKFARVRAVTAQAPTQTMSRSIQIQPQAQVGA